MIRIQLAAKSACHIMLSRMAIAAESFGMPDLQNTKTQRFEILKNHISWCKI